MTHLARTHRGGLSPFGFETIGWFRLGLLATVGCDTRHWRLVIVTRGVSRWMGRGNRGDEGRTLDGSDRGQVRRDGMSQGGCGKERTKVLL